MCEELYDSLFASEGYKHRYFRAHDVILSQRGEERVEVERRFEDRKGLNNGFNQNYILYIQNLSRRVGSAGWAVAPGLKILN